MDIEGFEAEAIEGGIDAFASIVRCSSSSSTHRDPPKSGARNQGASCRLSETVGTTQFEVNGREMSIAGDPVLRPVPNHLLRLAESRPHLARLDPGGRCGYTFVIRRRRASQTPPEQADRRVQGRARARRVARRDAQQERVHSQRRGAPALDRVPALPGNGHRALHRRQRRADAPRAAASALRLRGMRGEGPAPLPHARATARRSRGSSRSSDGASSTAKACGPTIAFCNDCHKPIGTRRSAQEAGVRELQRGVSVLVSPRATVLTSGMRFRVTRRDALRGSVQARQGPCRAMRRAGPLRGWRTRGLASSCAERGACGRRARGLASARCRRAAGVRRSTGGCSRAARPVQLPRRRHAPRGARSCGAWAQRREQARSSTGDGRWSRPFAVFDADR